MTILQTGMPSSGTTFSAALGTLGSSRGELSSRQLQRFPGPKPCGAVSPEVRQVPLPARVTQYVCLAASTSSCRETSCTSPR